jgi:hypothetical protein
MVLGKAVEHIGVEPLIGLNAPSSVTKRLNKIMPNLWQKWPNIYIKPEFESPKYLLQTAFETLKYLQQTMC